MSDMRDIDRAEFVIEPLPSGFGYHAYLPKITATRGLGDTPEEAIAQLKQMLDPANSVGAIMDRMPVISAEACQLLHDAAAAI